MKKVILFIIDSLHPLVLQRTLAEGNLPALKFLADNGRYWDNVVSCFPTMTPVATSSIMTGKWPDEHEVPGFIWYDEKNQLIVDYGATWQSVIKIGPNRVINNLLHKLNEEHLNPNLPTIHEVLESNGLTTGNINFFIHRSTHSFIAQLPLVIAMATGFRLYKEKVFGPNFLTIGEMLHPPLSKGLGHYPKGMFNRFGVNDRFSGKVAVQMIREGIQPDFMVVYFPDNDTYSHRFGPLRSGPAIERADNLIGQVLDSIGSWQQAVEDNLIIVTGDHSQSTVGLGNDYLIEIDRILKSFKKLKFTEYAKGHKDIAICPNERSALVYILRNEEHLLPEVVGELAKDERNAQVAWKESDGRYFIKQGGTEKTLSFTPGGPYKDVYGQTWNIEGDLQVVDAHITNNNLIIFKDYPDAFSRLRSSLEARKGCRVAVSAQSGYEYFGEGAPIHPGGGSHGSLEQEDSTVPMIIAGGASEIEHPRIVDLFTIIGNHFLKERL